MSEKDKSVRTCWTYMPEGVSPRWCHTGLLVCFEHKRCRGEHESRGVSGSRSDGCVQERLPGLLCLEIVGGN